jgi:hypothetical protein
MTPNPKALGLAFLIVFALGAVAASSASAVPLFHSEKEKTVITGGEDAYGTIFGTKTSTLSLECKEVQNGTMNDTTPSKITLHPTYTECKEAFGLKPTIDTDDCDFIYYAETTEHPNTAGGANETDAPFEMECTTVAKPKITLKTSGGTTVCTITITSVNKKLHGVIYDNEGSGTTRDIKITPTIDNIEYTAPGIGCRIGGLKAEGKDMFLTKNSSVGGSNGITLTGYEDLDINPPTAHQDVFTEGARVGIWWE